MRILNLNGKFETFASMLVYEFFWIRVYSIQIQNNGIWTSVYGESIGTRGEVLLGDGETIATVRYTMNCRKTTHMEFTTSKGTTFGPFGWEDEDDVVTFVVQVGCFLKIYEDIRVFPILYLISLISRIR